MEDKYLIDINHPEKYITRSGKEVKAFYKISGETYPILAVINDSDDIHHSTTITKHGRMWASDGDPYVILKESIPPESVQETKKRKPIQVSLSSVKDDGVVIDNALALCDDGNMFASYSYNSGEWAEWIKMPDIPQD